MGRSTSSSWVIGTALLCAVLVVLAFLGLISPKLTDAQSSRDEAEAVRANNEVLRAGNAELRALHTQIDDYRAEIAELRAQIPEDAQLTELTRTIDALAVEHNVFLVGIEVQTPQIMVPVPVPAAVEPTPTPTPEASPSAEDAPEATEDATEGGDGATEPLPEVQAVQLLDGFVGYGLTLSIQGPLANVRAFLAALQSTERIVLVGGFEADLTEVEEVTVNADGSITPVETPSEDVSGRLASDPILDFGIGVIAFVLQDTTATVVPEEDTGPGPELPGGSGRNPFRQFAPVSPELPTDATQEPAE